MIPQQKALILYNNSPEPNNTAANKRNVQVPHKYPQEINNLYLVNNPYSPIDYHESGSLSNDPNIFGNEKKMYSNHLVNPENKAPKSNKLSNNKSVMPLNNGVIDSGNLRLPPANIAQNSGLKNPNNQPRANYGEVVHSANYENFSQKDLKIAYKPEPKSPVAFNYNIPLILLTLNFY